MGTEDTQTNVIVSAFTEDQVVRLTGISKRQLRYWDNTDFFTPSLAYENRRASHSRLYSFRDIVCLKVLHSIRNEIRVPLPHLREVKEKLAHLGDDVWSKTTLYVLNKRIVFVNPETEKKEDILTGQMVLQIPLEVVSSDMQEAVQAMRRRDKSSVGRIERHRNVVHNQPVIAGTRIPVRSVKAFADAGYSVDEIRKEYPTLTDADIRAAIDHAA